MAHFHFHFQFTFTFTSTFQDVPGIVIHFLDTFILSIGTINQSYFNFGNIQPQFFHITDYCLIFLYIRIYIFKVCTQLTADYELKLATSENALFETREEVKTLTRDRETYEETMKKAFMRGVCALSMEAMTMFQPPDVNPPPETTEVPPPLELQPEPLPPSTSSNYVPIAKSLKKSHISSTSTSTLPKPKDSQPPPISIHSLKRTNIAPSRGNKHKVLVQRHAPVAH